MSRYRRFSVSALAALAAGSVALGLGLALTPFLPARAAPTPEFTLEFPGLVPGIPQTDSATYTLERNADLVSFAWLERSGVLTDAASTVDIQVCDSAGHCLDPTALAGPVAFAAGAGTVTVTVELIGATDNGESGAMSGRLSFLADENLAVTGADAAPWLAAGAAAVAVGALGLALTRRRERPTDHRAG